jgi:gamma-glutamyltranspeptidase/glutathione hydrolase
MAAQAGLRILLKGGNAVDAAIAAAAALTVVEPTSNGIGSDAFAIVQYGKDLFGLNASGKSPAAWNSEIFRDLESIPRYGWNSVTVPGAVSGWVELSNRFGKLPFEELFEPAMEYARNGFLVSPITAAAWSRATETYKDFPGFLEVFCPEGKTPQPGDKFVLPDHAKTLDRIAETKGEAFYHGDLAQLMINHCETHDGFMTMEDLASHKPEWVDTISLDYRGYILHELPPNGQGIAALIALGILQNFEMSQYPVDSADSIHLQIEAMKLAIAEAQRHVSDPETMKIEPAELLKPDYLASRARHIDMSRAKYPEFEMPKDSGTVYLTTADATGMMVSMIQSNFCGFGSGIVVPGTGISLQNRGYGFNLEKGHPNCVAGGKRPFHTIIPAFVTKDKKPLMSFGIMGGPFQPQGHTQVMVRLVDYGQNPQAACDAPRWRVWEDMSIAVEPGFKSSALDNLSGRGHRIERKDFTSFGGGQFIYRLEEGYCAASDHRKDGQAVGY